MVIESNALSGEVGQHFLGVPNWCLIIGVGPEFAHLDEE